MAKRKKKKSGGVKVRTRTITKTKTRRIYVNAKRQARKARRALGQSVSKGDIILAIAGAGVGSIGGSIVLSKMPESIPDVAKNGVLAAMGGFMAYKGLKKKNRLLLGLGLGAGAAAATNLIGSIVSGSSSSATVNGCALAAPYTTLGNVARLPRRSVSRHALAAPYATMAAPIDAEEM